MSNMFDLTLRSEGLSYRTGLVEFDDYDRIRESAERLAQHLAGVEVTEENVKESKKLVAEVRKAVNALDQERKDLKKIIMGNFADFEGQVKEINAIVTMSEDLVRKQVRELEEQEREKKLLCIRDMWDEHADRYEFTSWYGWDKWFDPRFLNKSVSLTKLEETLIEWLERVREDVLVIDNHEDREELMVHYENTDSLAGALYAYDETRKRKEELADTERVSDLSRQAPRETFHITLYDEDDFVAVTAWLDYNNIKYTKERK